jgi:two-component system cell cycle sensor histidine kinase/response regulator CckA
MTRDAALFQAVLDSMPDGVLVVDREGRVAFANQCLATLLGLPVGELRHEIIVAALAREFDRPAGPPFGPPDADKTNAVDILCLKNGRTIERRVAPLSSSSPGAAFVAVYRDITDQVDERAALDEYRRVLEKAQQVAHIGSWVVALDGSDRVSWSPEMYRIHGITPDQFDGSIKSSIAFIHEDDRAGAQEAGQAAFRERHQYEHEHRIVRVDGTVRWVRSNATMACDEGGKPLRLIGTLQDVTERRELEDELRQAQKMDAVGRLAGGIAHDLNNALTAIAGFAELALADLPPGHTARDDVTEVRRAAERAASVTRQLLAFSRREILEPRMFSLADTVTGLNRLLGRVIGTEVELVTDVAPDLPNVLGDPGQLEQAIVNLAVNARDAMPRGGRLTIGASLADIDTAFARSHVPMQAGRYVVLSVADTGDGMSEETRARIFEPFFTTKPAGKGTGLGLSMVYGTMKQSGGFVYVDSEPGVGSTFRLYFPPAPREATGSSPAPASPDTARAATVLVVDDEPSVRSVVRATLHGEGYCILEAASAEEALRLVETGHDSIDLLLTDATMPGAGGLALAEALLSRQPELAVIVMSGYTEDMASLGHLRGAVSTCEKPFTPSKLRQRVREALTG